MSFTLSGTSTLRELRMMSTCGPFSCRAHTVQCKRKRPRAMRWLEVVCVPTVLYSDSGVIHIAPGGIPTSFALWTSHHRIFARGLQHTCASCVIVAVCGGDLRE